MCIRDRDSDLLHITGRILACPGRVTEVPKVTSKPKARPRTRCFDGSGWQRGWPAADREPSARFFRRGTQRRIDAAGLEFAGGAAPSPRGALDESKDHQTDPEVHDHAEVESRRHVAGGRRQMRQEQKVDSICLLYTSRCV